MSRFGPFVGARRDMTYFVLGGAGARLWDATIHEWDPAGAIAAVLSGVVMVVLVWLLTGWRIAKREEPL